MSVSGYVVEPCPYCGKSTAVEHVRYDNCFMVRCLHCGYTSGHIASERGAMIRHNKICRALPKPDPEWKDICAKCKDGDIEPRHCEYYGEPNGCNSPIYGEHPKSAPVGNAAAMREALVKIREIVTADAPADEVEIANIAYLALAKPPRNCDVGTAEEQHKRFKKYCFDNLGDGMHESRCAKCPLYGTTSSCHFDWEQMPYEKGGAS